MNTARLDIRHHELPDSIDATVALLEGGGYVTPRSLATVLFLATTIR